MHLAGFESAIQTMKQLQTYALDCTATRIGMCLLYYYQISTFCLLKTTVEFFYIRTIINSDVGRWLLFKEEITLVMP